MSEFYMCRLCLVASPTTFPILNTKAADMLEALTDIKVDPSDEVLTMCVKCSLNLKLAYAIQRKFLLSDERMKNGFLKHLEDKKVFCEEIVVHENVVKTEPSELSSCIVCDEALDETNLISHTKQHFSEGQYCNLCGQSFVDIKSYRAHLVLKHPEFSPYKCDKCDATFLYKTLYDVHLQTHVEKVCLKTKLKRKGTLKVTGPFSCKICARQFQTRKQLYSHTYNHKRKECPICKKSITRCNFHSHMQNHNSGPQVCEHCGKTYANIDNLRSHMIYEHKGTKFECKECNLTFKGRHIFNNHNKRNHGEGRNHICETCGRKFILAYLLKKHILATHMKVKPYSCEFCKKSFSKFFTLKTHRRIHTNETPYKCEDCGEGFRQNVSLRTHRKSKHNVVEVVTIHCEVCGKGFSTKHALKSHMRCH